VTRQRREYAIALQYVRQHYPELYLCAEYVALTPSQYFPAGQEGQCSHDNFVSVRDDLFNTGDYVNVLVHELVHCRQNRERSPLSGLQREEEAYAAGNLAAEQYLTKAAPWSERRTV
jgi:hypothetical protein